MKTEPFDIDSIPTILYGEPSKQGYLFLHGQMGRKEEAAAFAQVVCPKGFQVCWPLICPITDSAGTVEKR